MLDKSPSEAAVEPRGTLATDARGVWRGRGGRANMLGGSVLLAACVLPFVADPYVLEVATMALLYIVLCLGLNVVVGYAGLLDLGYAAFFAVGAYTTGILTSQFDWSFWATLPVAAVAAAVAGVVIGMPTLRLRSDYLAIVTLGFGEIIRLIARNLTITGGASGLYGIERPVLFGIRLDRNIDFYFMFLILVVLVIYVSDSLSHSRIGRAWLYVRFDEDAAAGIGINRVAVKLYAYIVGAVIASLAGTIFAVKMTAVSPESFTFSQSLAILLGVVLGGMGKIPGVILGAIAMTLLPELMRDAGIYRPLVTAVGLLVLMLFRPQGLWPDGRA